MDWSVITAVCAAMAAGVMGWKMWRMKRDIYGFADALEQSLDAVIRGEQPREAEDMEDTLLGKVNEKLRRVNHILEKKEEEAVKNRQKIKELISDISHQTKTPIANQKICLDILRSRHLPEDAEGFLDKLERQTDRLDFLFQSLVKMSRLETGVIQIRKADTDLMQTLRGSVEAVVPAASKKGIALAVEREAGDGPLALSHDRKWTEEAVYNLLDNAVKYTSQGGRITVRVQRREIFTEIHVIDTGKGIALERQAQIFARFYREPEVHGQEGIGIGLYLTRKIAEMQSGYVEVHSEEGNGSDFCIYLPNTRPDGSLSDGSQSDGSRSDGSAAGE